MNCQQIETKSIHINSSLGFNKGQVFTPEFLAKWVGKLAAEEFSVKHCVSILDPACGDGELLKSVASILPKARLFGIDIDSEIISAAQKNLPVNSQLYLGDMLGLFPITPGKSRNFGDFFPKKFDAVIANPPWGADTFFSRTELQTAGYSLANGQFDSWSLFVESSLSCLKENCKAVFILPDAIFLPEHESTRKFLADNYTIDLIARLGEGIFKGINRGTVVIVIRNISPSPNHQTEVFRLTKRERLEILLGQSDLSSIRKSLAYLVPQNRFQRNQFSRWDIDISSKEQRTIQKIENCKANWASLLNWGRGVELSKKGVVRCCKVCSFAIPAPIKPREVICRRCGNLSSSEDMSLKHVIYKLTNQKEGYSPFVAGEDIERYRLRIRKQIAVDIDGLNYKDFDLYSKERVLIRKTGVGLKATLTNEMAVSNQVVFHFTRNSEINDWDFFLPYVLGIFSSRIIFAYHLKKSGENEWRSHPYVTPKILATLPIPVPEKGTSSWTQAHAIAEAVRTHLATGGTIEENDIRIERLVAGIYQLDSCDISWVKKVILSAQNLEPMRSLKNFDETSVFAEFAI